MGTSTDTDKELLPQMRTDVSLRSDSRTIIIDAKFHKETLTTHHGKQLIKAENLYQLFAYLKNLEKRAGPDGVAEGVLLYPTVSEHIDRLYKIQDHRIRIYTVNLADDWPFAEHLV